MTRLSFLTFLTLATPLVAGGEQVFLEEQELLPTPPAASAQYGRACAVSGDTAVVGAQAYDGTGSAFVHVRGASGWTLQQELRPAGLSPGALFGVSVALDGDTLVVGALADRGTGAAYVFVRSGTTWTLAQQLVASDAAFNDRFGSSLALDGDRLVVGAYWESTFGFSSGAAYAFSRVAGVWTEEAKLQSSLPNSFAEFGRAVTLDGDTAVVGQPQGAGVVLPGNAFVFERDANGAWSEVQVLVPVGSASHDQFGRALDLDGDTMVADGPGQRVSVFERVAGVWSETAPITAVDVRYEAFGFALALEGDVLLIGSLRDSSDLPSGSAYVFDRTGAGWVQRQQLTPSDDEPDERFGCAVGLSGTIALVGAYRSGDAGSLAGSAYAFRTRPSPFAAFCDASDGALAVCPCGNAGAADTGCDNPQATGGVRLDVTSFTPAQQTAELRGVGFPPASSPTVLLIRSSALEAAPLPLGDGVRCLAPPILRLNAVLASLGASATEVHHQAGAGTFWYQLWYRSTPAGYCDPAAEFNTSNGVRIMW